MKMQIKETSTVGIPFFQIEKEVDGIGWVGDSKMFNTHEEAAAALAARQPAPKAKVKLSSKMNEVMNALLNAPYYYLVDHIETIWNTLDTLHTVSGIYRNLGQPAHRVSGDRLVIRDNSSTLLALAKRGLVEVIVDGGRCLDTVRLPGVVPAAAPLASVIEMKVTRSYEYRGETRFQTLVEYAAPDALHLVVENHAKQGRTVTVEVVGEVTVSLWNPKD